MLYLEGKCKLQLPGDSLNLRTNHSLSWLWKNGSLVCSTLGMNSYLIKSLTSTGCSSTAIEEARKATQSTDFSLALFTYCSFQLSVSQKLVHVLGALLAQLSDRFPQALDVLEPDFRKKSLPSPNTLLQILRSYARELKRLYIFIDAVNESDECEKIIGTLLTLAESEYQIHVMATSTAASVTLSKDDLLRAQMKPSSNQNDIQDFVNAQLETRPSLRYLPPHTKRDITTTLVTKANGM